MVASERRTSGIVTPEAVLLQFETAGVASRGLARILDLAMQVLLLYTVFTVVSIFMGLARLTEPGLLVAVAAVAAFVTVFGYPIGWETLWAGRTPGKAALGLRVVTREGAPVRFRHAAIRGVVGLLEVLVLPFIAVLTTAISPANQRVGDLSAGTIVVRERSASRTALALTFPPPPGWEAYARTLDVSVLTPEQYRVVRSFLTRVLVLTPDARARLALRLANPIAVAMRHQPPAALGPELFLVCVASAYQVRHGGAGAMWPAAPPPIAYSPVAHPAAVPVVPPVPAGYRPPSWAAGPVPTANDLRRGH